MSIKVAGVLISVAIAIGAACGAGIPKAAMPKVSRTWAATTSDQLAVLGLQLKQQEVFQSIAQISTDRQVSDRIVQAAQALVSLVDADREHVKEVKSRYGIPDGVAIVFSNSVWVER